MPAMAGGRHAAAAGVPPGWSEYLDYDMLREGKQTLRESNAGLPVSAVKAITQAKLEPPPSSGSFRKPKDESGPETLPPAEERLYAGTMHKKVIASRASGTPFGNKNTF